MFDSKDFIQFEEGSWKKRYAWFGLCIYCWKVHDKWNLAIEAVNNDAEVKLNLSYEIGDQCTSSTVAKAMKAMFDNKYTNAYHNLISGIFCGIKYNYEIMLGIE